MLNTSFYEVFKEKLHKQKEALKKELNRAKSERRKDFIKKEIKEAKEMRNLLKDMEKQMGKLITCPHCGKDL
jgi:hypothetical protein